MSSADDPGVDPEGPSFVNGRPGGAVHSQLVEALMHVLVEKGVLTKNDALSIVQTVAYVKRGEAGESSNGGEQAHVDLKMLERMYSSFEALAERPGVIVADGENVRLLRPPLHRDRPEFPHDN